MLVRFTFAAIAATVLVAPVAAEPAASTAPGPKKQVKIDVKFITVAEDFFERIGVTFTIKCDGGKMEIHDKTTGVGEHSGQKTANPEEPIFLDAKQLRNFLESIQGDIRSNFVDALKAIVSDGKMAVCQRTHIPRGGTTPSERHSSGYKISIRPRIVADRAVALKMNLTMTNPNSEKLSLTDELTIPTGRSVVLGGWKRVSEGRIEYGPPAVGKGASSAKHHIRKVGYTQSLEKVFILVTATIVDPEKK